MKYCSIYDLIKEQIDTFPIYTIKNHEFTLTPIEFTSGDWLSPRNSITFRLYTPDSFLNISIDVLIEATEKTKNFLFKKFNNIISYNETWDIEDNRLEFEIVFWKNN